MQVYADPITGLETDSSEFRKRAPRVNLSEDPDTATIQTVQEMCRQIHHAAKDPVVIQIARRAVQTMRGGPGWALKYDADDARRAADSCWWWCKLTLKFRHHSSMFETWSRDLGDPGTKLQLLIAPDVLVRMRRMEGDCAIYTMMLCAMLEALGLHWQIVTIACDRSQPGIFSHVCARSNGVTLDASHGSGPGWQVPAYDTFRLWVFDQSGNRIQDSKFSGLHAYRNTKRGMWGMGDVCNSSDPDYDYATCMGYGGDVYSSQAINYPPGGSSSTATPAGSITAPAQNSAQWAVFASNLAKMGFTLAQINAIQPGTVVGPNGQILRQNPGYAVPAGGTASFNSALGGNTLVYVGLGLVAVFALMMGRR